MKIIKMTPLKGIVLLLVLVTFLGCLAGCGKNNGILEVPAEEAYSYINPDETKAETDAGIVIDGILDEEAYKSNNWLYLHNDDGGNNVNIAMTSYYGQKGMYFVFDVTESVPIYVNLDRASYMNSCIEMYLSAPHVTSMRENDVFEIDLMPTGDMLFKRSNGRDGYTNVATTDDIMACLGTTTKGGPVNSEDCYGYCMELFIPWDYLQWLKMDVEAIKNGYVYVNPAHITSNNLGGTDTNLDRYWYHYVQQNGVAFSNVSRHFRFNGRGVMGSVPVTLEPGEHYTISGASNVIPGMNAFVTVKPNEGYALTSIMINDEEQIQNMSFHEDGSVTLKILGTGDGLKVSAKAQAVSEGAKTLSGKVVLNNINKDTMDGLLLSYIGPKGEKPLEMDASGNFELKDLEQGHYILKAEKNGYKSISRDIYLNQDFYTELVLEYDYFQVTLGNAWILDKQNDGVLYKREGEGQVLSTTSYNNFTLRANLKYDQELAKLGTEDSYTQQRTGMMVRFSNGKTWHIDLLKENDNYILQYAKISGNKSVTNWKTIHTLNSWQASRYTSEDGIQLSIMRQGNYAAIWLEGELIKIEILDEKYDYCTAQLGLESWASTHDLLEIPFSIAKHSTVDVKGSPFLDHAKSWNISGQYRGVLRKQGTEGVFTALNSVITTNDVTTVARDLSPDTKDYSLAYTFTFSNGEKFRIRLHHTDSDGVYRVQSMDGSTVAQAWKVGYSLTEEQSAKIMGDGIEFRVQLDGTTAYVYIDGAEVCTYDLSKIVSNGKPSGVDRATAKVSFAMDGNYGKTVELPFKMVDTTKDVQVFVTDVTGGTIAADKQTCKMGETVTLTIAGNPGCYYTEVCVNDKKVDPNWDGTYSFKATENIYLITGQFIAGDFQENPESSWNIFKQNQNCLYLNAHATGNSGWLTAQNVANDISTTVRDASPATMDFSMIYHFDFSNGETLRLRLNHTDADGKYTIQVMDNSTVSEQWKSPYTLTEAEEAKVKGEGIKFRTLIEGTKAMVYLDGNQVCTIDLSKVVATGNASGVGEAAVQIKIRMDGNLNQGMEIPFKLIDTSKRVEINIDAMTNGKVTADDDNYQLGDIVTLTVTPDSGYSQKVYINGKPLLLDWKTNIYSFEATDLVYNITGSFEPNLNAAAKDSKRWDTANQAHGIFNAYYPSNDDAWLMEIKDEYRAISVKAKNYVSGDDGTGAEGFAVNLGFRMSNGKEYIFRIIKEKGKYYQQRFGINGNDWTKKELNDAAIAALCGDGATYKLERTSASTLTLSVNGVVYDNYVMEGVTAETKVTAAIIGHYGNKGEKIELPFTLKKPTDAVDVKINIAQTTNGTVTAGQDTYQVGDTVILTVTPAEGYTLKSLVVKKDGQPVEVNNQHSFIVEDGEYTVEAEFVESIFKVVYGNWDLSKQNSGILTILDQKDGTTVLTNENNYKEVSVTVKDFTPSKNTNGTLKQGNFSMQISFIFDNGKEYQVRMHNTDKDGNYKLQNMGGTNSLTGWKWMADLTSAQKQKLLEGDGVEFTVKLAGPNAELWVDGSKMATVALGAEYDGKLAQVRLCMNGNKGIQNIEIPFELKTPTEGKAVKIDIAASNNGTVTLGQDSYQVGDTVSLKVTPADGYALKSLVVKKDGQPVTVSSQYTFVAEDGVYSVEAEFAKSLFSIVYGNWDLSNQHNGILTITEQKDGTTVLTNAKNYKEVSVTVKDYTPSKNTDGTLKQGNFSMQISLIFEDGKQYQARVHNTDKDGNYKLQTMGSSNSLPDTKWKGLANLTDAQKAKLLDGDGVQFTVKLNGTNAELYVDGTKMATVALGAGYDGKLVQVKLCMNGNRSVKNIEIPFDLK